MQLPRKGEVLEVEQPEPQDERYRSVTTIIGDTMDKSRPLMAWAVNTVATKAVAKLDTVKARLANEGEESAVEYVKGLQWETGGDLSASALGEVFHALMAEWALDPLGRRPDVHPELHPDYRTKGKVLSARDVQDLSRMLGQGGRFLQEHAPKVLAVEFAVYNRTYGYAGSADLHLELGGVPLLGDYKTSRESWDKRGKPKGPYPEVAPQLAAYRHAEIAAVWRVRRGTSYSKRYYYLNDDEAAMGVPVPEVDGGVAVYVTPERYDVYPVRCDATVFRFFLHCLEVSRFVNEVGPRAVGNPMVPPFPTVDEGDAFEGLPV